MNFEASETRNVWSDLMAAYLICSFNLVYFYLARKSQFMQIISLSFPIVSFFVGIEYANWIQIGGSLIQWRDALIPIAACITTLIACHACLTWHIEYQTAVGHVFDSENIDVTEELSPRENYNVWSRQILSPRLIQVPIFTREPDNDVIHPQAVVPPVETDATETPLTVPMTPLPTAPMLPPCLPPPDKRGV